MLKRLLLELSVTQLKTLNGRQFDFSKNKSSYTDKEPSSISEASVRRENRFVVLRQEHFSAVFSLDT
mgnify:CR=1 FL=1